MLGFCVLDEKKLGPVQEYVPPPADDKLIVEPEQTVAPVPDAIGNASTVTVAVEVAVHPAKVPVTVYVVGVAGETEILVDDADVDQL